ncbi:MAG: sigma-70 family RNA polymerase sigma factor [Acidobacteria bacterium]|nr:sigma-70 family RNA polymerase sigma factor [Acidobacteriota bacterium]MBV9475130.1 sigma-70 family RNA polymerase sigma factor [Acidobacteriota bacterium]
MSEVTQLLREWSDGNAAARDALLGLVYGPLRSIAARHLQHERGGHTLQPTALVHELYLRLVDQRSVDWRDRAHFFAVAAQVMRRILVDYARRRKSEKRGGNLIPVTLGVALDVAAGEDFDIVDLDTALDQLAAIFPQQAKIVELRFYGGLTLDETAAALAISPATVSRDWAMARAWLRRALSPS